MKKLWQHGPRQRGPIVLATIYSILNKIFDIAPPILIGLAVDVVVKREESFIAEYGITQSRDQLIVLGVLTFLIWAFESYFEFLLKVKWKTIAQDIQHSFRQEAYEHLQKLELSFFEDQNTGNLTSIVNDDVNQLERFLNVGANDIIQLLTTVITIGGLFFYISPSIAIYSFMPIPFILIGTYWFQKRIGPRYLEARDEAGMLSSMLTNNLTGMSTIKAFVAEKYEMSRLMNQSAVYSVANQKAIRISSLFSPLIRMVVLCGFMVTLIGGGMYVFEGHIEVGAYSILIFLVQRLLWPMTRLGDIVDLYQRAMASVKRIMELIERPIDFKDGEINLDAKKFKGEVQFENLSFSYQSGRQVLKDISLEISAGETIAIVGGTGSGKSTLLKLLLRFYQPTGGLVKIDGVEIDRYQVSSLRQSIGLVSQESYLFHGTVLENILYGSFDRTKDEVIEAAKMSMAHDFIMELPNGYETMIGERGQKLSGGQRQRLCIARALVKDPQLFIFDEATSAVDNETEALIQKSLDDITRDRTTIMVAHRLSTIVKADKIYVLDEGRIVEVGKHQELLENKGLYFSLWNVQTGGIS